VIPFGEWLRTNWEFGTLLFLIGIIVICGLSLIPTNLVSLVGGYAFGFWIGIGVLMSGIVGASIVSFLFGSRISGTRLPEVLSKNIRADSVYKSLLHEKFFRTTLIIALLRAAFMPFAFTNFLLASARVSIVPFAVGTFIGMLPRTAAAAFAGAGLAQLEIENTRDIVGLAVGVAATFAAIIAIARFSRNALLRITDEENLVEDARA
jgi:uncharacterized membrane protein YdjX (TVP38/TMEM64 family)